MLELLEQALLPFNLPLTIALGVILLFWLVVLLGFVGVDTFDMDLTPEVLDADTFSLPDLIGKLTNAADIPVTEAPAPPPATSTPPPAAAPPPPTTRKKPTPNGRWSTITVPRPGVACSTRNGCAGSTTAFSPPSIFPTVVRSLPSVPFQRPRSRPST